MKKCFIILLILSFVIINSASALATSIDVYPSRTTKAVGSTFNVDIRVNDVAKLSGFDIKLYWNPSVLELVKAVNKTSSLWPNNIKMVENISSGAYKISYVQQNPSPSFSGSSSIATLTFKVKSVGSCSLDLRETELGNENLEYIKHTENDGYFSAGTGGGCSRCFMIAIGPYLLNIDPEPILSVTSAVLVVIEIVVFLTIYNRLKHTKRKKR